MSPGSRRRLIGAFLLLLLLRHLLLAFACAPYGDDWGYAAMGIRSDPWERLVHEHHTWNGRYFSNALVLYGPLTLGIEPGLSLYRSVPVLLIILGTAAGAWLLAGLPGFVPRRVDRWMLALAFTLLHLHAMPHLGEGLYWYTGAVTYQGAWVLVLAHAGAVLRLERAGRGWSRAVVAIVALIAAVGSNETAMALLVLGHTAWVLHDIMHRRMPRAWQWSMLAAAVGCGLVVALAPGNAVRGMHFPQRHDLLLTLGMGGAQALRFALVWVTDPGVLAALLLAWLFGRAGASPVRVVPGDRGPMPWLVAAAVALCVGTVLPYWSMGMLGQHRTLNFVLGPFLIALLGAALALGHRTRGWRMPAWLLTSTTRRLAMGTGLAALLLWGNDRWVTHDLLSGEALRFRRHTTKLHRILTFSARSESSPAEVPVFHEPLRSLRIPEPTADPDAYWNRTLAGYFGGDDFRVVAIDPATARPPQAPR